MNNFIKATMIREILLFLLLATPTVALLLFILLRRLCATRIPLLIVDLSLVPNIGVVASAGVSIRAFTHTLPSFLLSVGICDTGHVPAVFFHYYRQPAKTEAFAFAIKHSVMAVLSTNLTTAMGFLSFSTTTSWVQ